MSLVRTGRAAYNTALAAITPNAGAIAYNAARVGNMVFRQWLRQRKSTPTTRANTSSSKKRVGTFSLGGSRKKAKKGRKVKFTGRKPKINKKFKRKVDKIINYNENYGIVKLMSRAQIRQTTLDRVSYTFADQVNTLNMDFGTTADILHLSSIAFNGKTASDAWNVTTNNFTATGFKCPVISYLVHYKFKSTSSHVVNVEMYICRAKTDVETTPVSLINETYTNIRSAARDQAGTMSIFDSINVNSNEWASLLKFFSVEKRVMQFQPGDEMSQHFKVCGTKTYDFTTLLDNNSTNYLYSKGSIAVFFKVFNSPTVSLGANDIHHWQSSAFGGIAVTFQKDFKCRPPANTVETLQTNGIFSYQAFPVIGSATDQQVVYQNPLSSSTNPA